VAAVTVYTGNGWEIRCGRWQDSAPKSADVVISDPPFTDDISANGARVSGNYKFGKKKGDPGWKPHMRKPELSFSGVDPFEIGPPLVTISTRWIVLFCAQEQLGDYKRSVGGMYREGGSYVRGCIWSATNQQPQFTGDRPASPGEGIAVMHPRGYPGGMRWNGGGKVGIYRHPKESGAMVGRLRRGGEIRVHETQKPLSVMLELVRDFSDPGELTWDPYCGSGTTGVACLRLGRRFLGHEMQPHYAQIAAERLQAEERGLTLQDARRGQTSILDVLGDS
jgi:site-specific DNA-methyltransferase (adenine-specific)